MAQGQQSSDEVMDFIRTGQSPATTVKRKLANLLSASRAKVYDTLGPYFNPDYISPDDPRRTHGMAQPEVERSALAKGLESVIGYDPKMYQNVRGLSMKDTGIDLFDPSPMGEIHAASSFLGGIPRKEKEVMDLLGRFGREGWNRGQVIEELKRLGHNPLDFMDAIKARFGGAGLHSGAALDLSAAPTFSPTLGGEPTVAQRMRSMGGLKPPTYAGTQDMGGGKSIKLYNLTEDIIDPLTGMPKHTAGSTVSENTLKLYGIVPDRRESVRLPNEFENLLMKADPGYAGGAAKRAENPFSKAEFAPRAGARASYDDTPAGQGYKAINEEFMGSPTYEKLLKDIGPENQHYLDNFISDVNEGEETYDDLFNRMNKEGVPRNVLRKLKNFLDSLGD